MTLTPAPLFEEIAGGPPGGAAYWRTTADGVRIRVAAWPASGDAQGTVVLLPGRTEYIEKYGTVAAQFAERGFNTVAIDWRGQGLADRILPNKLLGHVEEFDHYINDLRSTLDLIDELDLLHPLHLVGHSMGGGIGLYALLQDHPFKSCAFTGPMWGISFSALLRPIAWPLVNVASAIGFGTRLAPTTSIDPYVLSTPFEENVLTRTRAMYDMMRAQLTAHPELALGGPTIRWVRESLSATRMMVKAPVPDLPCLTFLGSNEQIVDADSIHQQMDRWTNGKLVIIENGEHEVLMEGPDISGPVLDQMAVHFAAS